ncbi:AaceriAGL263Wp [[Ashbya] aceris (nom. inval.)]|nr:AaceriAGL263Wp [[Ashbya] aceris (nom. inval.)]
MSYNGIGLKTAKGSSTSGHIQRSLADNQAGNVKNFSSRTEESKGRVARASRERKLDGSMAAHAGRREVEVRVSELRDELEDAGVEEAEIERQCEQLRRQLQTAAAESARVAQAYTPRSARSGAGAS